MRINKKPENTVRNNIKRLIMPNTGGGGGANLSYDATTRTVSSDSGTDAVITLATTSLPGLMSAADKAALDAGINPDPRLTWRML